MDLVDKDDWLYLQCLVTEAVKSRRVMLMQTAAFTEIRQRDKTLRQITQSSVDDLHWSIQLQHPNQQTNKQAYEIKHSWLSYQVSEWSFTSRSTHRR